MIKEVASFSILVEELLPRGEWRERIEKRKLSTGRLVGKLLEGKIDPYEVNVVVLRSDEIDSLEQFLAAARTKNLSLPFMSIALHSFITLSPLEVSVWGIKKLIFPHSPPYMWPNHEGLDYWLAIDLERYTLELTSYYKDEIYNASEGMAFIGFNRELFPCEEALTF
ncbi:MAG: hypothetical protein WC565_01005 [Parcubacteria group bacterium]